MRSFSYTPRAGFRDEFLLLTLLELDLVRKFSYTLRELVLMTSFSLSSRAGFTFSEEFLLHSWSCVREEFQSLTFLELFLVSPSFSYTPRAGIGEEFLLHSRRLF